MSDLAIGVAPFVVACLVVVLIWGGIILYFVITTE